MFVCLFFYLSAQLLERSDAVAPEANDLAVELFDKIFLKGNRKQTKGQQRMKLIGIPWTSQIV